MEHTQYEYEERVRIGSEIASIRQQQGLSQRQLAEKSGLSHVTIARVEQGRWSIGLDLLTKISDVLGYRVELSQKK